MSRGRGKIKRMKVLVFYRKGQETERLVEDFMRDYARLYPDSEITLVDVDTVEGSQQVELYDVVRYPTVIAARDDGGSLQRWDSGLMPLMNEVAYYANQ